MRNEPTEEDPERKNVGMGTARNEVAADPVVDSVSCGSKMGHETSPRLSPSRLLVRADCQNSFDLHRVPNKGCEPPETALKKKPRPEGGLSLMQ